MTKLNEKKLAKILIFCLLLGWLSFFLAEKINLTTADLGRHLKNGQIILEQPETRQGLLKTNFYSFTTPNTSFVNHHWGSGVLFYQIYKLSGFGGLSFFYILLMLGAFALLFSLAQKKAGFKIATFLSLLLIPLIASRTEIRPEVFSYFLASLFFWLLSKYQSNQVKFRWLYLIPILGALWINLHIYFFVGLFLIGLFWLDSLWTFLKRKTNATKFKNLSVILFLTAVASLLNPFGYKALLLPLKIFDDYGYRLVENQSIWFLQNLNFQNPDFLFFKIAFAVLIISLALAIWKNKIKIFWLNVFLITVFSAMALLAIRNFALFALFALPVCAWWLRLFFDKKPPIKNQLIIMASIIIFIVSIFNYSHRFSNQNANGLGLIPKINKATEFFKQNHLNGPVFNNYDIGGYLIFNLWPEQKVFVDNRPEAYPADFLQDVYIAMQEDNDVWHKQDKIYNFNSIFFYHRDYTPWSQEFLIARLQDPKWAPVYVDDFNIIFLKRNQQNQSLIEKYEISKEKFNISK